jgi:hypothetical protein
MTSKNQLKTQNKKKNLLKFIYILFRHFQGIKKHPSWTSLVIWNHLTQRSTILVVGVKCQDIFLSIIRNQWISLSFLKLGIKKKNVLKINLCLNFKKWRDLIVIISKEWGLSWRLEGSKTTPLFFMCFILVLRFLVSLLLNNFSQISLQLGLKGQNYSISFSDLTKSITV